MSILSRSTPLAHLAACLPAACPRRLLSSSRVALAGSPPILRFVDVRGEERFGAWSDATESRARVCARPAGGGPLALTDEVVGVDVVLPPVDPPAIWCVGLNYASHCEEVKLPPPAHPTLFLKTVNTLIGHRGAIVIPSIAATPPEVDYEAELAVVIGREARDVPAEEAMDYVMGYTIANDVTARRWQGAKRGGGQWARGKCFDTFLPLGPALAPRSAVDLKDCSIRTWVNGDLVQDGNTADMLVGVPALIAFISQGTTLLPGTVILTGTPAGVGYVRGSYLKPGDDVRITIAGVGTLSNPVTGEGERG